MIKDVIAANENVLPNDKELAVLREHFPACFHSDGSFDIERFKEYLVDKIAVTNEGYELKFLGKNYARLLASMDTTTVIVPDEEHNKKTENEHSKNIYISGDNLDGLKHLLKSYAGIVNCIYIDPPYNTGSDGFVYNDNYIFTAEELSDKLSISEEQSKRILDLTKRGSASHSAWLMFMYPRLVLAKDLLDKEGVIFISIDDNELNNLALICNDIFEQKFINENTASVFCSEFHNWVIDNLQGRFRYAKSDTKCGSTALSYADGKPRSEITQGRIGTKIVPGTPGKKYLYDTYAYDSPLEKNNIIAEIDEVSVYGKIPRSSISIPTITGGTYSPDFMYIVKKTTGEKAINIIVETKDVEGKDVLRGNEKAKINCAKIFFENLSKEGYTVHFRDQLKNKQILNIIEDVLK
ncbi:MAG: hypothetical protein IJ056_06065 [Acidaminococcaceae bacterium]|nr:hypothetical protein [Acidaminococcaceae bacterium]